MALMTRFFIFLPLFIIFVVFANDEKAGEVPKMNETEKVLVEVTDAIEEDEEEEVPLVYKPSIAPATPQLLMSSSKYIIHDVEGVSEDVKTDGTGIPVSIESKSNSSDVVVASKVESIHISPSITIEPSSSSSFANAAAETLSTPSLESISSKKEDSLEKESHDSPPVLKIENEKSNLQKDENMIKQSGDVNQDSLPSAEVEHEDKDGGNVDGTSLEDTSEDSKDETKPLPPTIGKDSIVKLTIEPDKADLQRKDEDKKEVVDGKGVLKDERVVGETEKKQLEVEPESPAVEGETPTEKKVEETLVEIIEQKSDIKPDIKPVEDEKEPDIKPVEDEKDAIKMIPFAKWKEDKEKKDSINQSKLHMPKSKTIQKKKNKIKKNFASIDCGGKVISANEEASNILSVLKEDKDIYMLNPCNVRAWFVVELCDRIQVDSIDLANFEMFSSTPEFFNVYVTSRYPTGSWEKVDTFHAKNEKQVQTFVFNEVFYAKYIKIEIKKYFGSEHYCPLSLLRVFGITEVEQFDDDGDDDTPEDVDDVEHENDEKKIEANTANIFEAAKNVVAGLVNGMAIKLVGKSDFEANNNSLSENSAVVTVTAISNEPALEGGENSTRYYKDSLMVGENFVNWELWYYYRYPKQTCPITDPKQFIKEIRATVYFNENSTFISNPLSSSILSNNLIAKIVPTPKPTVISKTASGSDINISFLKGKMTLSIVPKATPHLEKSTAHGSVTTLSSLDGIPTSVQINAAASSTTSKSNIETNTMTSIKSTVEKLIENEESADELHFNVNATVNGAVIAEKLIPNVNNNSDAMQNVTNENASSLVNEQKNVAAENNTSVDTPATDIQQKLSASEQQNETTANSLDQKSVVSENTTQTSVEVEKGEKPKLVVPDKIKTSESATEISSKKSTNLKKTDNSPENLVEKDIPIIPIPTAKPTSGSKESIIAKLNSKVKGLEANLTMSMMYLDEMSERYQAAVEKVDERHKKKYATLNSSFHHQQELIKNQSILVSNLTNQIHEIVAQLQNLTLTTQDQHQKMIETHATWVFLEIIFILAFLLLCRSTTKSHNNNYGGNESVPPRRFSEPVMVRNEKKVCGLKRQVSDPTGCSADNSDTSQLQQNAVLTKKRKRKKNSKTTSDFHANVGVQNIPATTEKAGLIFGRNWMNGITGAFKRKPTTEKMSRQADALIDEVSDVSSFDNHLLRKVKSSELPVIHEDNDGFPYMERPRSCNDLEYYRKCN